MTSIYVCDLVFRVKMILHYMFKFLYAVQCIIFIRKTNQMHIYIKITFYTFGFIKACILISINLTG